VVGGYDRPVLAPDLTEQVLERLGVPRPDPDLAGLAAVYAAWCRRVPFDNVRKRIHLAADDPAPLPGETPEDFFDAWLLHGTGGTCWGGNGALHALLEAVGFTAERGIATMMAAPDLPPNHGTVIVTIGSDRFMVDASILHGSPLLVTDGPSEVRHPAWGITARRLPDDGRLMITWPLLHRPDGFECRLERIGAPASEFRDRYEQSRTRSGFNDYLYVRLNTASTVIGAMGDRRIELKGPGEVDEDSIGGEDRIRFLVEEIGLSEEISRRLPPDRPRAPA
jgi:N-hydroxyarylamine O-acetyltransferase